MHDCITWIGMDVHKESIVVTAVGNDPEPIRARFELSNTDKGINRLVAKIQEFGNVRCVYEAGPCGFELRRILDCRGIPCDVVAPSLTRKKPGIVLRPTAETQRNWPDFTEWGNSLPSMSPPQRRKHCGT